MLNQFKIQNKYVLGAFFALLPLFFSLLMIPIERPDGISPIFIIPLSIFAAPVILCIGFVTMAISRRSARSEKGSTLGFVVPSLLACLVILMITLSERSV
jgi:hypothetical protein